MAKRGRPYYVYELIDPRDGKPFYVGKGQRNRFQAHEIEARRGVRSKKCDRITAIWVVGLEVERRIVKRFRDEWAAYRFEIARIAKIGLPNLTNIAPGGPRPMTDPEETKDRNAALAFVPLIAKTRGFTYLPRLWFGGEWHELPQNFNDAMRGHFLNLLDRRGADWLLKATKGQLRCV